MYGSGRTESHCIHTNVDKCYLANMGSYLGTIMYGTKLGAVGFVIPRVPDGLGAYYAGHSPITMYALP